MNVPIPDVAELTARLKNVANLEFVSKGGFKVVFRGEVNGGTEAVKVMFLPGESEGVEPELTAQFIARAKREIAALGDCENPALVKLGSLNPQEVTVSAGNYLAYSEEFIPGEPMRRKVTNPPSMAYSELWTVFRNVVLLIEELSGSGYLHRDIKPDNIMETGDATRPYVVLDMGIAYKMDSTQLTQGLTPPRTTRYAPPELLQPDYKDVMDFRCDVYSLGLSIYELASGIHPYAPHPEEDAATVYRILKTKPKKLQELRPDLPAKFCQIVDRCMKKNIALRYGRIDLLKQELKGVAP